MQHIETRTEAILDQLRNNPQFQNIVGKCKILMDRLTINYFKVEGFKIELGWHTPQPFTIRTLSLWGLPTEIIVTNRLPDFADHVTVLVTGEV